MDLFTDGWVNTSKNTINQADEQMRLLSHCIEKMNSYTKPLPRLWYFPDNLKCLVTLTNDGETQGETDFEPQFTDVDAKGAKMSIYILAMKRHQKNGQINGLPKVMKSWDILMIPKKLLIRTGTRWILSLVQKSERLKPNMELLSIRMSTIVCMVWKGC